MYKKLAVAIMLISFSNGKAQEVTTKTKNEYSMEYIAKPEDLAPYAGLIVATKVFHKGDASMPIKLRHVYKIHSLSDTDSPLESYRKREPEAGYCLEEILSSQEQEMFTQKTKTFQSLYVRLLTLQERNEGRTQLLKLSNLNEFSLKKFRAPEFINLIEKSKSLLPQERSKEWHATYPELKHVFFGCKDKNSLLSTLPKDIIKRITKLVLDLYSSDDCYKGTQ